MKKIILSLLLIAVTASFCSCALKKPVQEAEEETAALTSVTESYSEETISDNSKDIEGIITDYCEGYLTYKNNPSDKLPEIKNITTASYYEQLLNQRGHPQNSDDYSQSVSPTDFYYKYNDEDSISVAAICSQSVVNKLSTSTFSVFYVFDLTKENETWLISNVECHSETEVKNE